jgi:glycosyltransferase involved in cell wall biosynthesis
MSIVYVHSESFPSDSAGTFFALNTAASIAQVTGECSLLVPNANKLEAALFMDEHPVSKAEGLNLELLYGLDKKQGKFRFSWRGIFYRNVFGRLRALAAEGRARAVVTRDLRLAEDYIGQKGLPPLIFEAHNFYGDIEGKWPEGLLVEKAKIERERKLSGIEKKVVHAAAGVVFVTSAMKQVFADFYGYDGPSTVAPSGHSIPDELPAPDPASRTVAYVGQLHEHKGVGRLMEAVARLPEDVRLLVIGGNAYLEETKARAEALGIGDRTIFTGFVPPGQIPGLLSTAAVGVVPLVDCFYNRYLTSPMKAFDYIASGLPIVAPRLETLTDIFVEGQGAVLYEPDDVGDMADKILSLLEDRVLYEKMVLALPDLLARYSWEERAEKIVELIGRVAAGPAVAL